MMLLKIINTALMLAANYGDVDGMQRHIRRNSINVTS